MTFPEYISSAPTDEFGWWLAGALVVTAAGFIASFLFLRRTRLIEDTPTSRIRSAAQGYAELEGIARVMDGPPIISPLSAARCVWWRYQIEEKETYYQDGKRRTRWVTIAKGVSDDCFLLDDTTGECVVDPAGASVIPKVKRVWYGSTSRPTVGPEHGKGVLRALFSNYRYTEELIYAGNEVYALGLYRTQSGGPDPFDEKADLTELLGKWKHDRKMMEMLDVNKDGHVDMKEWEAAQRMARNRVREEHVRRAVETPDLNILAKPRDRRPYILSGVPQHHLIRRFRIYSALCALGMFVAGGSALWMLELRGLI